MRIVSLVVIMIACLSSARAQSVKYGNNETSTYSDSQKSSDFTYLMWDRNDEGDGSFSNGNTPKFFYWDNDDSKFRFLIDTGNMSQLDAQFNSIGVGTTNPVEKLHIAGNALIANSNRIYLSQNAKTNDSGSIRYTQPYLNIGWSWPDRHERAMVFESYGYVDSYGAGGGGYLFKTEDGDGNKVKALTIRRNGWVGIGTKSPSEKLTVNGTAKAKEIIVKEDIGADFVFEDDYDLPKLKEVEAHIQKKNHLLGIPSADEMKKNGVKVGNLQMKLLQKIEELTLHVIKLEKRIKELEENK